MRRQRCGLFLAALIAVISGSWVTAGPATADPTSSTTLTLASTPVSGGERFTASLTSAGGTPIAQAPLTFWFGTSDRGMTGVSGASTGSDGEYVFTEGAPDYGTDYYFTYGGDDAYLPATSNTVHVTAQVTTALYFQSDLEGATASGYVWTSDHTPHSGMTVTLNKIVDGQPVAVGTTSSDLTGYWTITLPVITQQASYVADIASDADDTASPSTTQTLLVPTQTTATATRSGNSNAIRGSVEDGDGTGQPGVVVDISAVTAAAPHESRAVKAVATNSRGLYLVRGASCAQACYFIAQAQSDSVHAGSWAQTATKKAPTQIELTARPGHPDTLSVQLTNAVDGAPLKHQTLIIYAMRINVTSWVRQGKVTTGAQGQDTLTEHPRSRTRYQVLYRGTTTTYTAASNEVILRE